MNYPISPHLADYAQSINQAKFGFTAKEKTGLSMSFSHHSSSSKVGCSVASVSCDEKQ